MFCRKIKYLEKSYSFNTFN